MLDGAARIDQLLSRAKELEMKAIAITDHGAMYGVISFYEKALEAGIKPIIGCEFYVAPKSRFEKTREENNNHLVLLAQDNKGYKNLIKLVTSSYMEGYYYKPRIDHEILSRHSSGLIGLSACLAGKVPSFILLDDMDNAVKVTHEICDILGKENFFLELQDHQMKEQKTVNKGLLEISRKTSMPLIATNDIHYIKKEDARIHELLLCLQTGTTLADKKRMKFDSDQFYLKSADEMAELFDYAPESIKNTMDIAERCNLKIKLGETLLPEYSIPPNKSLDGYLSELCINSLKDRHLFRDSSYKERLNYELSIIKEKGFAAYFLIVADFVNYAKEQKISVGPGRGSAAGSLVAYLLGITEVDPIKHNLLFERFLNPERFEMPDIDIDFEHERRGEVIEYVAKKYGEDKVAQIITFSTMQARAAIKDAGRVLGYPYSKPDRIVKIIDQNANIVRAVDPNNPVSIDMALEYIPDFREIYEIDKEAKDIIDSARGLEGLTRQDSVHAAGIVISKDKLTECVPLQRKGGETVTQYPMGDVSKVGLLKMDLLGLKMLSVRNKTIQIVRRTKDISIDFEKIAMDDASTFRLLKSGNTVGVFQLSESGMRNLLKMLQPSAFSDIVALIALYRPGPLRSGMHLEFVERKHRRKKIEFPHSSLEPILKDTYGIIVYQEQVMQIATKLASFSMTEADTLRKAMGKKKPEVIQKLKKEFIERSYRNNVPLRTAEKIFQLIEHFGQYGFNQSHSTAYALLAYQTAYLKANYPTEYMAAIISVESKNKEKVQRYLQEARRMGIKVLPPDINESYSDFTAAGNSLRFGLSAIRNVGDSLVELIINTRKDGKFNSFYDFCIRVGSRGTNKKAIESLIKSGAMDSFGYSRNTLLANYSKVVEIANKSIRDTSSGQFSLFSSDDSEPEIDINELPEMDTKQLLKLEKEMLGMYISDHPLYKIEKRLIEKSNYQIADIPELKNETALTVAGLINNIIIKTTKRGHKMVYVELEDLSGIIEVIVFPGLLEKCDDLIEEDSIIVVNGKLDINEVNGEVKAKIIASEIASLDGADEIKKPLTSLEITLSSEMCKPKTINKIKKVIIRNPGNLKVVFKVMQNGHTIALHAGKDYYVSMSNSLMNQLSTVIPVDYIKAI